MVTVLYNSRDVFMSTFRTWVEGARECTGDVEFVIIDNSLEPTCADLAADAADSGLRVTYRHCPENLGFAGGCNFGASLTDSDFIFLLNPDVWVENDTFRRLLERLNRGEASPLAVSLQVGDAVLCGIGINRAGHFVDRKLDSSLALIGPSGGAAVFPTDLYKRSDGLDADLFAWGEDVDLAIRLHAGGHRTEVVDLRLRHLGGHSLGADRRLSGRKVFLLARNRVILAARYYSTTSLILLSPVWLALTVCLAISKGRRRVGIAYLRGVAAGLAAFPANRSTAYRSSRVGVWSVGRPRARAVATTVLAD
ncbi:glycosyltransferase family 2 protein [Cryptosporangium arvum]|uniref:glycosyltransferase family 2 protein n=1 Tax=Cryptosporangium arvum TaxID=80871 RepID=UPI0014700333|nr:glycosyltransferase [Cryptosporangium arvum]